MKRSNIISITAVALILVSAILFARGLQERDVFPAMFRAKTINYSFPLLNIRTNDPLTILIADVVYFRVKRNASDSSYEIEKTCSFGEKFSHNGITGTLSKGDSVTGATSGATGTIGYVSVYEDYIWLTSVSGTFVDGEQVYETANTNYVTISDDGTVFAIATLTTSDTTIDIGDCFAYVDLVNTEQGYDETLLKSKLKVIQ